MAFEDTVGQFGYWALVIGFLAACFFNDEVRIIGYIVGAIILLIAAVRTFGTARVLDNGGYWAAGLVFLGVCYMGKLSSKGRRR